MKYKREKDFLQILCRDYILLLIDNVGWNDIQKKIVYSKYIEHKSITRIRIDLYLTSATYARYFDNILAKLKTYLICHSDDEICKYY